MDYQYEQEMDQTRQAHVRQSNANRTLRWTFGIVAIVCFVVFSTMEQTPDNAIVPGLWVVGGIMFSLFWLSTFTVDLVTNKYYGTWRPYTAEKQAIRRNQMRDS